MNKNPLIQVSGLSKSFKDANGKLSVLSSLDLELNQGEVLAIMGSSGSGKSTLLHILGGLDHPDSGRILIGGKDIAALREKKLCQFRNKSLGFIYQFHHLLPEFSALENVAMPLLIAKKPKKLAFDKAYSLLDKVGLQNRASHKISQLSGGERQRTAIARALVNDPLCVFADEPTGNLDSTNAQQTFQLMLELRKTVETSFIIVTHDESIARQADRVLQLQDGKLL
jgi:lipoprotein-releasing system ATP-binding protein